MESYQQMYEKVKRIYKFFGVAPRKAFSDSKRGKLQAWFPTLILLAIYWILLIAAVIARSSNIDLITKISNYIQLLLNGFAFSAVITSTASNRMHFSGILKQFDSIDQQFRSFGSHIDYAKHLRVFYIAIGVFFTVLCVKEAFETYVLVVKYEMCSVLYWITTAIPLVVYSMCLHQATFIVYGIVIRCRMVNGLLKKRRFSRKNMQIPFGNVVHPLMTLRGNNGGDGTIKVVYQLADKIHELCESVNGYFGFTFVASFMAIFAVSSIQTFYCYKIVQSLDEKKMRSLWTLYVSLNSVVFDIFGVSFLSYMSDMVAKQTARISNQVRKLEDEQAIQYSSWFHPVLVNIKISAFGFFNINCTMLCGFLSAWITYLLILVQYNEIGGDKDKGFSLSNSMMI